MTNKNALREAPFLSEQDRYLFNEGTHVRIFDKLGAHPGSQDGVAGTHFAVWAPNAKNVCVMGDFNEWSTHKHHLRGSDAGIWHGFVPGVGPGAVYKYFIHSHTGAKLEKADPIGFRHEVPPKSASVVWELDYQWGDGQWMQERRSRNAHGSPISVYEVHLGSWRRVPEEDNRPLSYREAAHQLAEYCVKLGFTHVELLPIMEHPFSGSWGYQSLGYFSPTARFGAPQDLMYLIDTMHQANVGVLLDWVPSHFAVDGHGLSQFDGTSLYEHTDPRQGFHPDWGSYIFNYGRNEVRSFLISSALFWFEKYHIDGLRVDGVASMLYLDYSRKEGEWIPNQFGGRENLEAVSFLRQLNEAVYKHFPDILTVAEESTAWAAVSRPTYVGGLGFGFKWDMGWMHDTLEYFSKDPVHRKYHHDRLSFRMIYAWQENFQLPLSHDEVTHGKGSLVGRMPGDDWQKFANLRLLLGYMYAQPGKKLLFMGGEFGQWREWNHDSSLDWNLLVYGPHDGAQKWVSSLNRVLRSEPALHELDCEPAGFEWVDCHDADNSALAFLRKPRTGTSVLLAVFNFTPVPRSAYRVGVPRGGFWKELLNSDAAEYGGSGLGNLGGVEASAAPFHGRPSSLEITLPPLSVVIFRSDG
ncbi:MAG: 1,4-alpha-glucan branching protein GlgB [Elusimicrobia bacterium]|nr:1,4-alpha-glucan branching protein GlgB [Elusimicrobiota bacterium]